MSAVQCSTARLPGELALPLPPLSPLPARRHHHRPWGAATGHGSKDNGNHRTALRCGGSNVFRAHRDGKPRSRTNHVSCVGRRFRWRISRDVCSSLADEAVVYEIKLVRNGDILDSDTIAVYAGEKHGIDLGVSVTSQSGKDGATVSYPFTVTNTGNIADNYNFMVSKNSCTSSDGGNSDWDVRFFEDNGNTIQITMANIPAQTTKNFLAKVT